MEDTTTNLEDTESELQEERELSEDTESEPQEDSDEQEVTEESLESLLDDPQETPKLTKEEKKRLNADSIAADWAEKLLNGTVSEYDIPEWVQSKAMIIANQVRGEDKLAQIETKFEEKLAAIELKYSAKENKEQQAESANLIRKFMDINNIDESEFVKDHGLEFKKLRDKYQQSMSKVEATEVALLKLTSIDGLVEASQRGKAKAGLVMPPSGSTSPKSSASSFKKELADYNAELAKVGVSPISEEAFKKSKEQGIL